MTPRRPSERRATGEWWHVRRANVLFLGSHSDRRGHYLARYADSLEEATGEVELLEHTVTRLDIDRRAIDRRVTRPAVRA